MPTVSRRVSKLVLELYEELRQYHGDELALRLQDCLEELASEEKAIPWKRALVVYLFQEHWPEFSSDFKAGYISAGHWLAVHLPPNFVKQAERVFSFLFGKAAKLPIDPFACSFQKFVVSLGRIKSGKMTEDDWLSLLDETVSVTELQRRYRHASKS